MQARNHCHGKANERGRKFRRNFELAQKVDGEIQVTQMEMGHVDDSAGYGVFQTRMAGQTIVFGIADPGACRETNSGEMTSVNFNSVMLRFTEGSVVLRLPPHPERRPGWHLRRC